jgi:hypothetical protein
VDCNDDTKRGVETILIKEERYPAVPRPVTVDCRLEAKNGVDTILINEER